MKRSYKIIRALLLTVILIAITVPATLYVALSLPSVQEKVSRITESELSHLLDAHVEIGTLSVSPFNRVLLRDVTVTSTETTDTLMSVSRIGAGINLYELAMHRKIVINYAELIGLDGRISRDTIGSPLNIQPIIDALGSKDPDREPSSFEFSVNTILIRNSSVGYDITSLPCDSVRLDKNHIRIYDLNADISLPLMKNDDFDIDLKRMNLKERSGLTISDIKGNFHIAANEISAEGFSLEMPGTYIRTGDISLKLDGLKSIKERLLTERLSLRVLPESYFTPSDIAAVAPQLSQLDSPLRLNIDISGQADSIGIDRFSATADNHMFSLELQGNVMHAATPDSITADLPVIHISGNGPAIAGALPMSRNARNILSALSDISFKGTAKGSTLAARLNGTVISPTAGTIGIKASMRRPSLTAPLVIDGDISIDNMNAGALVAEKQLGELTADISAKVTILKRLRDADTKISVKSIGYRGHAYRDIDLIASLAGNNFDAVIDVADPAANMQFSARGSIDSNEPAIDLHGNIFSLRPEQLNLTDRYPGFSLNANIDASVKGGSPETADSSIDITDIAFTDSTGTGITMRNLSVYTSGSTFPRQIDIRSDVVDASVKGSYTFATLAGTVKDIATASLPSLVPPADTRPSITHRMRRIITPPAPNDFTFDITIKDTETYADFLKLPVSVIYPVTVSGQVNQTSRQMRLSVDAPYLRQKNKLIENTAVIATVDGNDDRAMMYLTTQVPTKNGGMTIAVSNNAASDRIDTDMSWIIDRKASYKGNVSLSTLFSRTDDNVLATEVAINRSLLTFNDTTWTVNPATVSIIDRAVIIDSINVHRSDQFVKIDGRASDDPDDVITLDVLNLNLDYIFEALGIDKVMLGGDATGRFYASGLFTREPHLDTPGLNVKNIGYNHVTLGDAVVKSHWDQDRRAITLDAVISQANGCRSLIDGAIFPLNDSIDITFDAQRINVAFMKPYMEAFTSDISGLASGRARLWGNFKYIDMEGDIYGENVKLKINFTNTAYSTTDTVRLRPGLIQLDNLLIKDEFGNTARLNGRVRHKFFKEPTFDFAVSHARNLLCYDETSRQNPDWYGRIFGNGSAHINGGPGIVDIMVNMATAPHSNFTFVLSDMEEASDYSFITFRDRGNPEAVETDEFADDTPGVVRHLKDLLNKREENAASAYNIDLVVDITPDALITLIMDPVGGDRIRSYGSGNISMKYHSTDNSLFMNGKYTLDRGNYNFTLQDIIIKDFTINPGSTISFTGDPFDAKLNIQAAYALNANLSDLDESFLQDKDLNRTNVPVHALLNVSGSILQPDIAFDLSFPTLTQDTYRKVRSIISTDDMMNRQIIYLLALNRFYTPDYMASTTKGNELVSVASSTISSQLSNILGQLSDNWNIAPNFRSDRGDFSDVEVDLALSSHLLNNRLLFNGNFGYRDKSLNNNQFIGDFDLEYLLNKSGSIRLKAYNRYNDQNYYVRTANTTQGVGVMFKRNFDNIFSFLHRKPTVPVDSTSTTVPADTIPLQ